MKRKWIPIWITVLCYMTIQAGVWAQTSLKPTDEEILLKTLHSISSHTLYDYVAELCEDKYAGRLTGTQEYKAAADWVASHFKKWGLKPYGDNGTYFQHFPISYTLIFEGSEVALHMPVKKGTIKKQYKYVDEFMPGSTSGSGEITAEVIYCGYGITAPELEYDDYKGMDVKGKIILIEREAPVSPDSDADLFKKWRPYSFHQYKLENAVKHGAAGMLYNYGPIANPNNAYDENFIYSHVGDVVVADMFTGTGKTHKDIVEKIQKDLKPQSFKTGKTATIKNVTEHHPEGIGSNVIALIEGSDPVLKEEVIILAGHLDHMGRCYEIIPGANDNASAVAVLMGVAEAMAKHPVKPKRSILFIALGAEEQGVVGSEYYLDHPAFPLEKTVCCINMDGVGCGDKISAIAAKNFPDMWTFFDTANKEYIRRVVRTSHFANLARPRLDAARFLWKNVPTISFAVFGSKSYYHIPLDNLSTITPEIMEDLAQLIFLSVLDMSDESRLDFRQ